MKLALVALLVPSMAFADAAAQLTAADLALDQQLRTAQKGVTGPNGPNAPGWLNRSTPPFPDGASWVVFGYAWSISTSIADGELTGSIHGEARAVDGKIVVKALGLVRNVGVQGVHPVAAGTWPSPADMSRAYAWIVDGHFGAVPEYVKRTYCAWQDGNGIIKNELPATARAFLTSLGCK